MYGLKTWGDNRSQLVLAKKFTRFLTNSRELGRELSRKCSGDHNHQPLLDGRAKGAARYPPALCRAICRGILREKMLRACGVTAVLSLCSGLPTQQVHVEEHHEREDTYIPALIRKLEAQEEEQRRKDTLNASRGYPTAKILPLKDPSRSGCAVLRLSRLTERRDKSGSVSSQLAIDDLTRMELEAGNVIEARGEIDPVRARYARIQSDP